MLLLQTTLACLTLLWISSIGNAGYTLHTRVHSFSSPSNKCPNYLSFDVPGCCDRFRNTRTCVGQDRCDFTFYYCLRPFQTVTPLNTTYPQRCGDHDRFGRVSGVNVDAKELDYSESTVLGLPNPLPLRGLTFDWKPVQLYVEVSDADFASTDEFIDSFSIDIDQLPIGPETAPKQFNGTFGFATITLSFRVECLIANFFPHCVTNGCEDTGNCTCLLGFTGVDCDVNIDDCLEASCPENSECVDDVGSYSCQCLEGYSGDNCTLRGDDDCVGVDCSGNGKCVDDIDDYRCMCDSGYTGDRCQTVERDEGSFAARPLVILCIVAVLLVMLVVTIITITQFVLIKRTEKNDSDYKHILEIATQHNDSYNMAHKLTRAPNHTVGVSASTERNGSLPQLSGDTTPSSSNSDMSHSPILTTPNDSYNCLPGSTHEGQDTITTDTSGLTPEPIQHTSTLENTPRVGSKPLQKFDIYDYKACTSPSQRGKSHTLHSEEELGRHADDIPTWQNPGYNCPRDHIMGQSGQCSTRAAHQQPITAPTPEHETFMSLWQQPPHGASNQLPIPATQVLREGTRGTDGQYTVPFPPSPHLLANRIPSTATSKETLNSELAKTETSV